MSEVLERFYIINFGQNKNNKYDVINNIIVRFQLERNRNHYDKCFLRFESLLNTSTHN